MKTVGGLAVFISSLIISHKILFDVTWALVIAFAVWFVYWLVITLFYEW